MIALGIALGIGGPLILLVLGLCRTAADPTDRKVAAAALGQDGEFEPAGCDCDDCDDLLDVWRAASADPDPVVRGFAAEVEGWPRDLTEGIQPPVIRPAIPPEENR